jgi:ferrous iron transport protein B
LDFSIVCCGFPALIAIITVFFTGASQSSILSALILTGFVIFSVIMTFGVSYFLSSTLLKGMPSTMALEMPPFRKPQIGKVIVRSILDRTIFVLGRAVIVAAPAGMLIWLFANIRIDGTSILSLCTNFLDPAARLFGLDGVILMAFILGSPANEIVLPIIIMTYTASGTLNDVSNYSDLQTLLASHGWTWITALCVIVFFLMHWPCTTTMMTIKKETGSLKWTILSFAAPLVCGLTLCFIISTAAKIFGIG